MLNSSFLYRGEKLFSVHFVSNLTPARTSFQINVIRNLTWLTNTTVMQTGQIFGISLFGRGEGRNKINFSPVTVQVTNFCSVPCHDPEQWHLNAMILNPQIEINIFLRQDFLSIQFKTVPLEGKNQKDMKEREEGFCRFMMDPACNFSYTLCTLLLKCVSQH